MRVIGLTGGIGSGKSRVSAILKDLGVPVIDADALTHACQTRGQPVWAAIWHQFGWNILGSNGEILRRKLGYLVFHDENARKKLNQLVHPSVRALMAQGLDVFRQQGQTLVVLDVPLLIEGGLHKMVDEVWVVYADLPQQLSRIMERDHVDITEAERRVGAQMPLDQKLRYAQVVIDNRGTLDELKDVVTQLWQKAQDQAKQGDG